MNDRIIDKRAKIIEDKEREERRDNIVIRGLTTGETIRTEWVQRFLRMYCTYIHLSNEKILKKLQLNLYCV